MLMLLGALGVGAYYLAAPIKALAQRFFPGSSKPSTTIVDRDTEGKVKTQTKAASSEKAAASTPSVEDKGTANDRGAPSLITVEPTPPIVVPGMQGSGTPPATSGPSTVAQGQGAPPSAGTGPDPDAGGSQVTVREAEPASIVKPVIVDEVNTEGLPIPKTRKAVVVPDDPKEVSKSPAVPEAPAPGAPATVPVATPVVAPAPTGQAATGAPPTQGAEPPVVEIKGSTGGGLRTSDPLQATTSDGPAVKVEQPEAAPAVDALKSFFDAKDFMQRSHHVLGAQVVLPLMERYYAKMSDGPIEVDEITLLRHDPKPEIGTGAHAVFSVASKQWAYPIPVMLQEEPDGFKVDWLAFVEFKDDLLFKFLSAYQEDPARFHVAIRRTHYFDNDVPNRQNKECFEILPPLPTYAGYVFVDSGTPLANDLTKKIGWETRTAFVIVELQWRRQGDFRWVELKGVPQLNWYSLPLDESGKPLKSSTTTSKGAVKSPPPTTDGTERAKPASASGDGAQRGPVTVTR